MQDVKNWIAKKCNKSTEYVYLMILPQACRHATADKWQGIKIMQPVKITDIAAEQIKAKTALKEGAVGLRLTVGSTGCSGNSYKMEHVLVEDLIADDKFEQGGAVLYVPKIHSWMLFGMTVDYETSELESGFTFTNPNEAGRCGCGESFTVERPEEN